MSDAHSPAPAAHSADTLAPPVDPVEAIVPMMPVVLPVVGAIMIFFLAMIAVTMA